MEPTEILPGFVTISILHGVISPNRPSRPKFRLPPIKLVLWSLNSPPVLKDLHVPKVGFRAVLEYMSRRGVAYTAATGYPFPRPIPSPDQFSDTWKEMAKALELRPPVSIADPPASGRSWPLQSWALRPITAFTCRCHGLVAASHIPRARECVPMCPW